jgi:hypothetical protein
MVYVDGLKCPVPGPGCPWLACRLWASSPGELADMARLLGLSPAWLRRAAGGREYYRISPPQRARALAAGAKEAGPGAFGAAGHQGGEEGCVSTRSTAR